MKTVFLLASLALVFPLALAATGCGYTLRTSKSQLLEREEVRKIYIAPLENNTFKAGIENLVYNTVLRELSAHMGVKLVRSPEEADAQLIGSVETAQYTVGATVRGDQIEPIGTSPEDLNVLVARTYNASLRLRFRLNKNNRTLWTSTLSRSKTFPASNRLGVQGTTSALINDSEFDRALDELARLIATEARESMLSEF